MKEENNKIEDNNPYQNLNNDPESHNQDVNEDVGLKSNLDEPLNDHTQWDMKMRLGFIRKVYGILVVQLAFTFLFCLISTTTDFITFQINNIAIFYLALIVALVSSIVLICFRSIARSVPTNYILLGLFTLCEAYMVGLICGLSDPETVIMAAFMTLAVTIALTIYAYKTESDFTMMGGLLFVFGAIMLLFGIFMLFTDNPFLHIIYCCFGVLLYSMYLIYDTQLIIGEKKNKLSIDDYIVGAMMLYTDIIGLFLNILELLSKK